jgi:SAM-dependent methyltransferase
MNASFANAFPDRLYSWEGLSTPPDDNAEPYTLQWFLAIENERHNRQARWIPGLLEFTKHAGETMLGLGNGLGTDWIQYARHGAKVVACSPLAAELALIRRNFELRGLNGRFLHAAPVDIPLGDACVDVVCVSGLLHEMDEPKRIVSEIFRVLRPGGKVLAVVPARYNIDYWKQWLPWSGKITRWFKRSPWRSAAVAQSAAADFSGRGLKRLFAEFRDHRVYKRQLRRKEAPWLWRMVPRAWLEKLFGRYLVLKAFKPVMPSAERLAA